MAAILPKWPPYCYKCIYMLIKIGHTMACSISKFLKFFKESNLCNINKIRVFKKKITSENYQNEITC